MLLLVKSVRDLPDHLEKSIPEDEKRYRNLKQTAYLAIGEAKTRGDEDFLARLRNETRRSGRKLGDKATPEENRRMIEVLRKLSPLCNLSPPPIKSLVPDGVLDPTKASRAIHTQIRRFCLRAYQTWKDLDCPPPKWWKDRRIKKEFQESCGFEFPQDIVPAREAIKRGKKYAERKLKKKS